jgi:imidazolonepropionase-like amidohydrolase
MIVEEAHRAHLTAESHTMEAEGLRMALSAGADAMQHPEVMTKPIPDDIVRTIVTRKVIAVPIVTALWHHTLDLDDPRVLAAVPPHLRAEYDRFVAEARQASDGQQQKTIEQFRQYFQLSTDNLKRLMSAGAVIAMGTDAGTTKNFHEAANHFDELEWYVKLGMTQTDALLTATRNAAILLRRDDLGTLAPGKVADLVIVGSDPLKNISAMRDLRAVVKDGRVVLDRIHSGREPARRE